MSFTSKTSSIKRKDAFSEELSAVLGKRGLVSTTEVTSTTYCEATTEESGELIFTANQDFIADDLDALTLHRGEQVILLDTGCDPSKRLKLDPDLDLGTDIGSLLDNTAARHKISVRPRRKHADSRQKPTSSDERWLVQCCDNAMRQGWVPACILTSENSFAEAESPIDTKYQREAVIRELVETEEEFGRDIQQVVDEYLKPLDGSHIPRIVRDNKELIFNNLKQIADFHNTVLIEGLKYYANDPRMLGKTFLRLERDFDKHVTYCRDEPAAQDFLMENEEARDFFEELSQQLGDDKSLCEHLKLPIQRINDYQLLLKELVKYSKQLGEDTADLGKALELMLAVPHRANDNKFISNIEGYHGNIHKLGRLLRHDWFCVTDRDGKSKERYLFLFKARILICKVRRISEDRFVFVLKDIIRLPDVEVKDHIDDSKVFELHHKQPGYGGYPLTITAHKDKIKDFWLAEIRQYASDVLALAEHAADDLRLQELSEDNKNLDLPTGIHIEPATPEQSIPLEPREGDSKAIKTDIFAEFQKKREARTVKVTEDTKKLSKASEEKVLTEQPSKLASEQPKQTEHTANQFLEVIPVPVTEAQKLEPKVETLKAVTEQPRPVSEPPKPITEPQKPVSEPLKPISDPQKPVNEPLKSTENQKPVTELPKLTSKSPEPVSEIPETVTEPLKLESEQPEPASKRQKIETEPSKLKTELPVPILEAPELISVSPKSVSEPQKLETEPQKPIAEKLVTEPPKPTAEPSKVAAEPNPVVKLSKPAKISDLVTEEVEQKPLQSQPINIPSSIQKTTEDTYILKEEKLETESTGGLKRKESPDTVFEKKVKIEEDTEMDGYNSYSSRKSGTRHVEVEEYRSVSSSSSQEVYVETASSRQQLSSGMSASQSMRMVEESTIINGQVVSHSREITGGGGGYTKIQELTAATDDVGGYTTIEEYISGSDTNNVKGSASKEVSAAAITEVQISDLKRRSSGPKFKRTIEGISIEPGERAVFECQVEEKAKVIWLKNNKPLEDKLADRINSLSHKDTHYRLEILGAHESDAGTYTARAVNESGASSCSALLLVEKMSEEEKKKREESRIPCFHVSLKDTEVLENTYLRFMVKVKGQKPDVKFYKNDRLITVANERVQINKDQADVGFYELIIPDVLQEDAGTYKCIASNRYGEAECEAIVTVTDDKKIFEGLEESDLLQPGEQPNFTWLRDGQPFDPEERFKVLFKDEEDSLALVFQHVKPEDAGLYTCVATTSTGKISCSAELTVQGAVNQLLREPLKPAISTEIKKVEANINGTAMLELTVDGYPKPEVKWTKDGKEITAGSKYKILYEDEKSMSLLIKNVSVDDAGSYKVEAKNELGSDSEEITLTVKAPPKIKTKLTDYSGMAGETIKMTVEIEGEPKPDVTWYKDGKVIIKSDHVKSYDESSTSFTLLIDKSTLDDAGSYSVVASNELSQTSEFCKVEVLSPPQFISKMTKNVISQEGETIIYQVKVQGEPKPTVKWFCNGNELKSDGTHIKITEDQQTHTLTVCGVTREDAGKYTCEISNVYGKNSDDSTLNVRCSPQFRQKLTDKVATEGDTNVEFTVNIEAFPKPNVKWFHNENEITEKITEYIKIEEGDNYKLIIKEVTTAMSGKYSCKVVNDLGSNETSATFTVHSKPKFSKGLKDIQVDEGASLTLQIEVEGTPDPVIKWYKDGEEVTGDAHIKITRDTQRVENYSMTFTLVKSSDAGEYEVRASNEMGTAITKSIVTVQTAPEIISTNMNDRNIYESLDTKFEVQVKGVPRPKAKWYKDGEELKSSDHTKITEDNDKYCLEIINAKITDAGNYKCKVVNTMGEKTQTAQLSITDEAALREPKIKVPLKDQSVPKNEETIMTVVLTADPIPEVKWTHDDKDVSETYVLDCESKEIDDGLKEVTYTLKILKGCHQDTGVYKFVAKNKFGTAESSARLDIVFKPEITCYKDVNTVPFSNTAMVANILANPRPDIKWSVGGKALDIDGEHNITENDTVNEVYKLLINGASLNDEGTYTVTASNIIGESSANANFSVHTEPPSIVKGIENHSLKDYEPFEFKIRANGVPKPQIIWLKDGEEILSNFKVNIETSDEGQVSSCLSIAHFSEDDAGKYIVKAVNMAGEVQSSAKLKMLQIPPSFLKAFPRSAEVGEGEPLELKAKLDGSPIPKVKWFKDGAPLVADDHVKLTAAPDGSIKLQIDNVKPTDCGAYKVVAVNPNGESTGICAVAVNPTPRRPSFSKELSDANVTEGEPLRLEAQVMAFPAPEVKWFKDGHPVRPSPGVSFINSPGGLVGLVVDKVRPEDAGTYTLTVANKLGDITSTAKVGVAMKEKKPQFLSQLMPSNVVEGFPAKMEIKISGHPPPQIAWTLNGKPVVPDGEHIKIVEGPDGSQCLLIDKATPADAGIYAVTAKNSQGEITSQAPLNVASKGRSDAPQEPPSFPKGLRDTTVDEETPLTFSTPFLGNPIPDVVWSKDGIPLQSNERIQFTCDGSKVGLEINPSKVSDAGIYSCKLKNPLGETESEAKATVRKIYQKPQFVQRISDLQQLPTFDAKFWARVTGNPKPEISWYKDGNIIKESPKYRIKRDGDTVCLYVQDCTPEDSGIYRCIASNKEGQDTCDAQLQVVDKIEKAQRKEAPAFLKKIGDCEVFKGMTAKFTACATGYPEPEVEWYREDEKLYPSERIKMEQEGTGLLRLIISGIDPQIDAGKYRCRIFNPYGEDSCEASILYDTLDIKPRKPLADQYTDYDKFRSTGAPLPLADRPIISRMTDRRLTLSWKPSIPIGPRDPVTYHVEMCELPNGDWFTARTGVRSCACDISNLEPFRDYKFRIRVENKYGISDPSPFAQTYREKLLPDPPKFVPYLAPGIDFRPETSPYFPKDFDIERPPHDGYAQAPRFLHQEHDTQYGVKGHNCNLFWFVYGYPKPKMQYFFNDVPIEMGGRYDSSYTRNGQATLFINKMLDRDVGIYEAVATNEHGEARQRVRLEIAEYPEFIKRPDETIIMLRRSGRLEARLTGIPPPEIKWYKDWQPLAQSSRIKIQHIEPDIYILVINDAILKDEGLYSISARNIAGSISSSVMVRVEENEAEYSYLTYDKGRSIKPRTNKTLHDLYDLGDELGRGTQGITYHAVERLSGRNYAAKVMHGKGELRAYMRNELEIMNLMNHRKLIRLHDAFEIPDSFMLITELAGGGELLDVLTKQTFTTESEISGYIRQLLMGLEHMHDLNIAHLGLTPGDLLISHAGGDDLKICDFGLARRIAYGKLAALDYGMPEFVAPEIINGEGVSFSADMWAVGIITHLLLTGISLFRGVDDRTTLTNIKEGQWKFNEDIWKNLSSEARDFITQLLVLQPERRMDVKAALKHPWLTCADKMPPDQYQITTDTLRNYYNLFKDWYNNASCRLWYRRRPLIGAFSHPSRMVYPPGYVYTPEPSPERRRSKDYSPHIRKWEDQVPSREPLDYELGLVKSESHYQNGPDTYLLQLRDVDFPVRLREYMKVAANRSPGYSRQVSDQNHLDWKAPVIRERRRFTDVMDEEIDDERKARINKYGSADVQTMRRLRHELGTRLDTHVEADALMEAKRDGHAPFFREKPQILPIEEDKDAQLVCYAVGDPKPIVQWFKNDLVVTESNRTKIIEDEAGRSILSFRPAASFDIGIYKVVARNKIGQVVARTRVVLAQPPDAPDSPDATNISDTEVLLRWKQPKEDGNSPVVCYSLQYKEADLVDWKDVANNIDHEFFVIRGLRPNIAYQFRLSARNKIGWSEKGIPTKPIKTKDEGAPKVQVTKAMKHLQSLCEAGQEIVIEEIKHPLDYSIERNLIEWSSEQPTEKYNFISEIARGRYSVVVKGIDKANDQVIIAKVLDYRPDTEAQVNQEFEVLRSLRHERVAALTHAFKPGNKPVAVFILEKLQGADILTYLSSRHEYTEQMVATVVTQVLDALQYLHWRGYCHLNLEPDNIVMASVRSIQIKLVDFGAAEHVSKLGTMVHPKTNPEYTAPEILSDEPAFPQSDIWSVGVLTYILLSGVSPFKGATNEETKQNINFVRFRFEHLYKEITQEATRFIMLLFKRAPTKRPTAEECHETRWLLPTEHMIKKRERAVFLGNRLKDFSEAYHSQKTEEVTKCESLVSALGGRAPITRSNSIQEELLTTV